MRIQLSTIGLLLIVCFSLLVAGGCSSTAAPEKAAETVEKGHEGHDHAPGEHDAHAGHDHAGGDELFWQREEVALADCMLKLGHHGAHLHAGKEVEPAVIVTRDGKDVPDAQVFVAIYSVEGDNPLAAEQALKFEPGNDHEPSHFALARLAIPADASSVVLRYRVLLPGQTEAESFDVPVPVDKH